MKSVFIGTVESSVAALIRLCTEGLAPDLVVTLPLSARSRHSDFADVGVIAARHRIPVWRATRTNSTEVIEAMRAIGPDLVWVIGWSEILDAEVLAVPRWGCVGAHPSVLPDMRGRAVVPWTILLGRERTGTTLFWLDEGLDSGDILLQEEFAVDADETARSLYDKHVKCMSGMLSEVAESFRGGVYPRVPQTTEGALYCGRRSDRDGYIEWRSPAADICRLVRASTRPYPGAFTYVGAAVLRVWSATVSARGDFVGVPGQVQVLDEGSALVACGDGALLSLHEVQVGSESPCSAKAVLRRHQYLGILAPDPEAAGNGAPESPSS